MTYDNLIFDFDGTLADSLEITRLLFNEFAVINQIPPIEKEEVEALKHFSIYEFLKKKNIPKTKFMLFVVKGRKAIKDRMDQIPLIQGMEEVIPKLKEKCNFLGILTSNSQENVELFLQNKKLESYFDHITSSSNLMGKARYLKSISKQFSLAPSNMLYIGDEIRDLKASKKAGMDAVGVPWGFNSKERLRKEEPRYLIDSPTDLLQFV